jgi:curved DNA-binding protein CbpA
MTRPEALRILDLAEGASDDAIRDAHRRLMVRIHPDRGGSTFLAAKLNEARDVLLRRP